MRYCTEFSNATMCPVSTMYSSPGFRVFSWIAPNDESGSHAASLDGEQEEALAGEHPAHRTLNVDHQPGIAREMTPRLNQEARAAELDGHDVAESRGGNGDLSRPVLGPKVVRNMDSPPTACFNAPRSPPPDIAACSVIVGDMLTIAPDSVMTSSPCSRVTTARLNDGWYRI